MITGGISDSSTLLKTGSMAPFFRCVKVDGSIFDTGSLSGKVIMINFFATWCPPCRQELPALQEKIWVKYRDNSDFALLVLGREHENKDIAEWSVKKGYTLPFGADPRREIYNLFASQYIPRNVIIDRDGKIFFQNRGYADEEFNLILALLSEKLDNLK
ncbi:MAG: TlpA disulfide reductase family protein [Bacteroidales bacterium]